MVSPIVYHGAGVLSSFICVDLGPFPTDRDFITFTLARTNSICEEEAKKAYPVGEHDFAIRLGGLSDSLNFPSFKKESTNSSRLSDMVVVWALGT